MHFAYLYSRYPVISQTFCDTEMLALERRGWSFEIGSIHPPFTSFRHGHADKLQAPIYYAPPQQILRVWEREAKRYGRWPATLVAAQDEKYGAAGKASQRARNALYFADLFTRHGVDHFHVHFANRAAQTALFVKAISGIPFSITAHGQDFMVDLGSEELLREICREAQFVGAETDYSADLLRRRCPDSAEKIHRIYNGMDLANFPRASLRCAKTAGPVMILSVGRLVPFKGFQNLIDACAQLQQGGVDFRCEIIGDGPLRESLSNEIAALQLSARVKLAGSLPQEEVFRKLRDCDIFALPCVVEKTGASDIFPTVILEAMASTRPVVSTSVAGVPESVVDHETGFLVAPNDVNALAIALGKLISDPGLRDRFGAAGRARIEGNFQIETTILPLEELFRQYEPDTRPSNIFSPGSSQSVRELLQVAYLMDQWPDEDAPYLETELREMRYHGVLIRSFVSRVPHKMRLTQASEKLVLEMEFLPDAIVLEAEWQQKRELARELEAERAKMMQRVPATLFLEQARCALALREPLLRAKIAHVHATGARSLVCGLLVRKMLGVTVSATVEEEAGLSRRVVEDLLHHCTGGRVGDEQLAARLCGSFLYDPALARRGLFSRMVGKIAPLGRRNRSQLWDKWAEHLLRWSRRAST
jgi:glycosyltransferase involved in cell wall biosynthesis